jgi:Fe-S cluster assembly protein SufD
MSATVETRNITNDIVSQLNGASPLRQQAAARLTQLSLPSGKNEEYRHTPLTRALEKHFDFTRTQNPASALSETKSFAIPGLDANVLVFINGEYQASRSSVEDNNVRITALNDNDAQLGQYADWQQDAFVAWNTAAWKSGIRIDVPANTVITRPVIIHNIHDTTQGEVKSVFRSLITVGKSSELTVIEKFDTEGSHAGFSNHVLEARVEENAGFQFFSLQADHGQRFQFGQSTIWQASNSRTNCYAFTLDGKFVRNNLQLILDGQNCEAHMYGLYLLHDDTFADNHTVVDHRQPNSFSNELYKGVLEGNSKAVFNGKIFVRPQAQKTNAFQSNRNILLSDNATINTKPQLEIWADDVKCSHGCTTGQLDEEALFYLQSRGIGKDTARAMMLYAFAGELIETIKDEVLRQYVDDLIAERLHKNF